MYSAFKILLLPVVASVSASVPTGLSDLSATGMGNFTGNAPTTAGYVRSHSWSMPKGNLIPNWSFENQLEFWTAGGGAQLRVAGGHNGKFEARLVAASGSNLVGVMGAPVLLKSGQSYILSLLYKGDPAGASIQPALTFTDLRGNALTTATGTPYASNTAWTQYNLVVAAHDKDCWATISLANGARPAGISLEFDDALLVERSGSETAPDRDAILEVGKLSDPTGISYHSFGKSGIDASYRIDAIGYDSFWRPETTYLSYFAADPTILPTNRLALATSQNISRGAGSTPFSRTLYPDVLGAGRPNSSMASSGDAWSASSGHLSSQGWAFVDTFPASAADLPSSIETWPVTAGVKRFRVDWARDPDGNYALAWKDFLGSTRLSARLLDMQGLTSPAQWKWAFTQYAYYPDGQLKDIVTPLEYGSGSNALSTITSYDQAGRVIATVSPDEGKTRYWYDSTGRVHYRQKASQIASNEYTYWTYDALRRQIAQGEVIIPSGTNIQAVAFSFGSESNYSPVERRGWIYDDLAKWDERNLPNRSIVLGNTQIAGTNGSGRLVAKYHRNPQITTNLVGSTDLASRLVADFYGYDSLGRLHTVGRYLGNESEDSLRRQSLEYRYDSAGRLSQMILDHTMDQSLQPDATRKTDMWYLYSYDDKGRVKKIDDLHSGTTQTISAYSYDTLGNIQQVSLGTTSTSAPSAIVSYQYHLHGQVVGVTASNASGMILYNQNLGYESPLVDVATSGLAMNPSYSGKLAQDIRQYGTDQNVLNQSNAGTQTVLAHTYNYDAAGRLLQNLAAIPSDPVSYSSTGAAALSVPYANSDSLTEYFNYDDNDRLTSRKYGVQSQPAQYGYKAGTNLLDHVSNQIKPGSTRDASASGTFSYDANGNLIDDASKHKWIGYDADGLVTRIGFTSLDSTEGGQYMFPYYDADGQLATLATAVNRSSAQGGTGRVHYVRLGGNVQKEIRESWNYANPSGTLTRAQVVNIVGQRAVIGRRLQNGTLNFYLKDHQGSTIRVVDGTGAVVGSYDYHAYGDLRTLHGESPEVTEKWTGKQYFDGPGLYYFGARWYDPELGIWTGPDPAHQYGSPYRFGTSPLNGSDPNGQWFGIDDAIFAGVGAIIGTAVNVGFNLNHINSISSFAKYAGAGFVGGAAGGEATLYAGPIAGGAAAGAITSGLNTTIQGGSIGQIAVSTLIGAGAGAAGGAAAGAIAPAAASAASGIANPILRQAAAGAIQGGVAGGVGGFTGGTAGGLVSGQSLGQSLLTGLKSGAIGVLAGGAIGGGVGAFQGYMSSQPTLEELRAGNDALVQQAEAMDRGDLENQFSQMAQSGDDQGYGIDPLGCAETGCGRNPYGIPDGWNSKPASGGGGMRYFDQGNSGNQVRMMGAKQFSPWPSQQVDYTIVTRNGNNFLTTSGAWTQNRFDPATHIPTSQFRFDPSWFQ